MQKYSPFFQDILRRFRADWRNFAEPDPHGDPWWLQQYKEFVAALRFLTTLPWPGNAQLFRTFEPEPYLIMGSAYFSLIGGLLALLLSLLPFILGTHLSSLLLAALLLVAQVLLTGGLHLEGLMDTCDGLFSGRSTTRKLEIMRDSRVGSFGVLGAACVLILKFASYASLSAHALPLVLFSVLPAARWAMLLAVYIFPDARPQGLGTSFRQTVTLPRLVCASLIALIIALLAAHLLGLLIWFASAVIALLLAAWITHELDGLTGDTYGAIEEVTEIVLLLLIILTGIF